jgi:ribosomal protein S18 acetylase RimI-like enzyme
MSIQPASPQHAQSASALIHQSGPAAFDYIFDGAHGPENRCFLRHEFRNPGTMFSYKHHCVYMDNKQVVATLAMFDKTSHAKTFCANARAIFVNYGWRGIIKGLKFEYKLVKAPKKGCLYIGHIAVDQQHQGKGIARQLIQYASEHAIKQGIKIVSLDVAAHNQRARALYLGLGFKELRIHESYHANLDDHVYMEKLLT